MTLQENDIVLCTVKRIEGTTVFLNIEDTSSGEVVQGTMIFSEVSPGRIRNIREFVVPNKKIVCKILRMSNNHPQLSLRRVTAKEREEVLDRHKKERILANMIKTVLKEKAVSVLEKIKNDYDPADFLDDVREDPSLIKKFVSGKQLEELQKIISSAKQEKEKEVKKTMKVTAEGEAGLVNIKKVLETDTEEVDIYYLGSSKFSMTLKAKSYKEANTQLDEVIEKIKEKAKKHNVKIEVKEK